MRIAVTGTHGSGKTTLIDDFVAAHPAYEHEQKPYWALAQHEGTPFAVPHRLISRSSWSRAAR